MDRLFDRLSDRTEFELVLRRVAYVARLVGLAWWVALGAVSLVDPELVVLRPAWVVVSIVVALLWAAYTSAMYQVDPSLMTSRATVIVDVVLAAGSIPASRLLAGSEIGLYGGFPFLVVVIAAIRGRPTAWIAATTLAIVSAGQAIASAVMSDLSFTEPVSQIFLYGVGGFISTWVLSTLRTSERAVIEAREGLARSEERSRISAHLHDSVLQTLALIQKSAAKPGDVVALSRRQERELRSWLYGTESDERGGLAESLRLAAADVEERYGLPIDVVTVGDLDDPETVQALVRAGREAMVNAVKHSGADAVSAYAQVDDTAAVLFIRDRGIGFDPEAVTDHHRGIKDSIEGRLRSLGGVAELRTGDRGTEWKLEVEL